PVAELGLTAVADHARRRRFRWHVARGDLAYIRRVQVREAAARAVPQPGVHRSEVGPGRQAAAEEEAAGQEAPVPLPLRLPERDAHPRQEAASERSPDRADLTLPPRTGRAGDRDPERAGDRDPDRDPA